MVHWAVGRLATGSCMVREAWGSRSPGPCTARRGRGSWLPGSCAKGGKATLHTAVSDAREGVGRAPQKTADKLLLREPAEAKFRMRFRAVISELEAGLLDDEDSRWCQFGLNRSADPATQGVPGDVVVTGLGGGRALVQVGFSRRTNSRNFYKQVVGVDDAPRCAVVTASQPESP
ncbi:MAG: hypothetical protein ABMA13_04375 [Chthoniobacteraceae bacterium]